MGHVHFGEINLLILFLSDKWKHEKNKVTKYDLAPRNMSCCVSPSNAAGHTVTAGGQQKWMSGDAQCNFGEQQVTKIIRKSLCDVAGKEERCFH